MCSTGGVLFSTEVSAMGVNIPQLCIAVSLGLWSKYTSVENTFFFRVAEIKMEAGANEWEGWQESWGQGHLHHSCTSEAELSRCFIGNVCRQHVVRNILDCPTISLSYKYTIYMLLNSVCTRERGVQMCQKPLLIHLVHQQGDLRDFLYQESLRLVHSFLFTPSAHVNKMGILGTQDFRQTGFLPGTFKKNSGALHWLCTDVLHVPANNN